MLDFGQKLGLETFKDEVGNVIIKNLQQQVWKIEKPLLCSRI